MERIPAMKKYLNKITDRLLKKRLKIIEGLFRKNEMNIEGSMKEVLLTLSDFIQKYQKYDRITISYLRSSYLTQSHIFLASCQSKVLFLEEELPEKELDFSILFVEIEQDIQQLEKELRQEFIRVLDGERETIRRWYMDLLYRYFGELLEAVIGGKEEKNGIPLLYGGYMEEQRQVGWVSI